MWGEETGHIEVESEGNTREEHVGQPDKLKSKTKRNP